MGGAHAEALISRYAAPEEVLELPSSCSACGVPSTTRMFKTDIPFFKARPQGPCRPCALMAHLLRHASNLSVDRIQPFAQPVRRATLGFASLGLGFASAKCVQDLADCLASLPT